MNNIVGELLSSNFTAAFGVAALIIVGGIQILRTAKAESPLAPYVLQIAGLTIVVPVLLVLAILEFLSKEALVGLMGTVVGYLFGAGGKKHE